MQILLSSRPNPDFSEDPAIELSPSIAVDVSSFGEASRVAQEYISRYGLGGGNFGDAPITENGKQIAYVSYNGRVWSGAADEWKSGDVPLCERTIW